jgi:GT2 family glycosyltransferase
MDFSIVIACKEDNPYLQECLSNCLSLEGSFEILVFPDTPFTYPSKKVKIFPTGKVGPAEKRDLALKHAKGKFLAFIDDDAYPSKAWLSSALPLFRDPKVGAVGGPAVTPPLDSLSQKVSGLVYSSSLGGGSNSFRYIPASRREIDDCPSCNLIVRKSSFASLGGFDSSFYPGEDTKFCLDLVKSGKTILYDPTVLVYHHRRSIFLPHLKQVWNYSVHRGFFVKKFPETSFRFSYFIPSLFTVYVFSIFFFFFFSGGSFLLAVPLLVYFLASLSIAAKEKSAQARILFPLALFLTHLAYGIGFVTGLITRELYN